MKMLSEQLNDLASKVAGLEKMAIAAQEETSEKLEERLETAKADAKVRQDAFQSRIDEEQKTLASNWKKLQANFRNQVEQIKSSIDAKLDEQEDKRVMRRADDTEFYAEAAIEFAALALDEAEVAALEAIKARTLAIR